MNERAAFAQKVIDWQKQFGRHGLPWQCEDPYKVWLSEIMLQQTQVGAVLGYYQRFLERFPTVQALAEADEDAVLAQWAGLGYYARARNLHAAAKQVMTEFGGRFPDTREELEQLKGVGRSTAAAVAVFAFGRREAILDGNVKRVLARYLTLPQPVNSAAGLAALWETAEELLPPAAGIRAYTQGMMDLGSLVCSRSRPKCGECPVADGCAAHRQGRESEFPVRAAKKAKPVKTGAFLLLKDENGAVFLEKRPASGIWGGLYCLPWFASFEALQAALPDLTLGEPLLHTHQFTHYTLNMQVFSANFSGTAPAGGRFFREKERRQLGLPVPVMLVLG